MQPRRLRAPVGDQAVLAEPPLADSGPRLAQNRERLGAWDHDFQGRRAGRLRMMARRQILDAARAYHDRFDLDLPPEPAPDAPLFVTGHQPELFHPGVWVKNFAVAGLARGAGGAGVNLIVDDDIPKWASVRVPTADPGGGLRAEAVDFDDWAREIPFEDWTVANPERFASFPARVRRALGGLVADPVLEGFWPRVREANGRTDRIGLRFAAARRGLEGSWGIHNWEVPLSAVCETEAFSWFACHILAHLPRFQRTHNEALLRYRETYGIRSKNHPVPSLTGEGEWLEAPFWAWRAEEPRRRPLLARQLADRMELRIAGEDDTLLELPLTPDREACCAVEALRELPARRVRLRTRALTTTMFARLILGDLFLHGIGGAKYDELGDEVVRGFFGVEPPSYLTLSMTLWLGLDADPATSEALREVEAQRRDLVFNPDRHLQGSASPVMLALAEQKRAAISGPQRTHRERAARYFELRRINQALAPAVQDQVGPLEMRRAALLGGLRRNAVARSREYAFILHPESRLRRVFGRLVAGLGSPWVDVPEK